MIKTNEGINMTDIMLDLETLSLHPEATVASIAAVQFNRKTGEVGEIFQVRLSLINQMFNGSKVDQSTLNWWTKQSTEAKNTLLAGPTQFPVDACNYFNSWLTETFTDLNNTNLWGNGVTADNTWIRNLFVRESIEFVIPYWCDTDVRTLVNLENYDEVKLRAGEFEGIKHDAIADCKHQIKLVHEAYKLLKE